MPITGISFGVCTDAGNFDDLMFLASSIEKLGSQAILDGVDEVTSLHVFSAYARQQEIDNYKKIALAVAYHFPAVKFTFHAVEVPEAGLATKPRMFNDQKAFDLLAQRWFLHFEESHPKNVSWITNEVGWDGHKPMYCMSHYSRFFINAPFSVTWFSGEKKWIDLADSSLVLGLGYNTDKVLPSEVHTKYGGNKSRSIEQKMRDLSALKSCVADLYCWNGYFSADRHDEVSNLGKIALSRVQGERQRFFHDCGKLVSGGFVVDQCAKALQNIKDREGEDHSLVEKFPHGSDPWEVLSSMEDVDAACALTKELFTKSHAISDNPYHHPETGNGTNGTLSFLKDPEVEFSDAVALNLVPDFSQGRSSPITCYIEDGFLKEGRKDDCLECHGLVAPLAIKFQELVLETLEEVDKLFRPE